jgi:hypothetical protein
MLLAFSQVDTPRASVMIESVVKVRQNARCERECAGLQYKHDVQERDVM